MCTMTAALRNDRDELTNRRRGSLRITPCGFAFRGRRNLNIIEFFFFRAAHAGRCRHMNLALRHLAPGPEGEPARGLYVAGHFPGSMSAGYVHYDDG